MDMGTKATRIVEKPAMSEETARAFGAFTRDRVIELLKSWGQEAPEYAPVVAAAFLATLDPHGPNPNQEFIAGAMDVLAATRAGGTNDLLWQAAEHAANCRIRTEAIKRSGPSANSVERCQKLRKWAAEGFNPAATFQNDQFSLDIAKEAAITALGQVSSPCEENIDAILEAMNPPDNSEKFSPRVFKAAAEAYWRVGTPESLPKLMALLAKEKRADAGLTIAALAAKFPANRLKPHADALRKVLHGCAHQWQEDQPRTGRLVTLAEKLATEEFLCQWSSSYGADGLDHGRGKITSSLLKALPRDSERRTTALLILAQTHANVAHHGDVVRGLESAARTGHGKLIATTVLGQHHDGHNRLIQSGKLFTLYPSMRDAVTVTCEAIGSKANPHEQRRVAATVALGLLVAGSQGRAEKDEAALSFDVLHQRGSRQQRQGDQDALRAGIGVLERSQPDQNPVALVARLACPPVSSPGAAAIIEIWLRPDDALSAYTVRMVAHEAGRGICDLGSAPALQRIQECLLKPDGQQPALRQPLEQALVAEVVVEGRLNRYGLELMQRENLAFERGATVALSGLQRREDADFLFALLLRESKAAMGLLTQAVNFHRDGDEELTAHVQAKAIESSVTLLIHTGEAKRTEAFARQLHQRFQDLPPVREIAYRACGQLGSFVSIKPLKDRADKEPISAPRAVIAEALAALCEALTKAKPEHGKPEEINSWLAYVADMGDPTLLPQVVGYLRPPHADHSVRRAALRAVENMNSPQALEAVKKFMDDTAPEGETLAAARRARIVLEERNDAELFDVLAHFYDADAGVLDPAINYENLLGGYVLASTTRGLKKAHKLSEDGHWDEFITQINAVIEAMIRHIFRTKYARMGLDHQTGEKLAGGNAYMSMLNTTQFRTTYGKLQAHSNTIQSFRRDSPTAHAMNKDGTAKAEATEEEAEYVRAEFRVAFIEAVNVLT